MLKRAESSDGDVCFICASPVIYNAIAPCGHRTCHLCATRLRALYCHRNCPHCRTVTEYVIFSADRSRLYADFTPAEIVKTDENLGIKFASEQIYEGVVDTLRFNCASRECDYVAKGWYDLRGHVKRVHQRYLCDLCVSFKKVFAHEQSLFTIPELRRHESKGDDRPGAIDQSGFKGHPRCDFENERFFDDDALYQHCRSDHERCHICDRRHTGGAATYYQNYDTLEQHFRASHFLCPDTECLEKKFVVFESEIDLKAHQLEAHPAGLSKDARREARRIDLSDFDFRSPMVEEPYGRRDARGRGGGGRRGRGRNPDIDRPIPASTAQPMTRAELAFQRIQALDNARPSSLSSTEAFAARPRNNQPHPTQAARAPPSMTFPTANLNNHHPSSSNQQPSNPSPQEQARRAHTAAVFARANKALGNDPPKVLRFRNLITQYSQSSISALNLIESFLTLFYTSASSSSSPDSDSDPSGATELGKLIHELVDLFDAPAKQKALLTAWNDWKAMNLDYPSLALGQSADPSSGVPGGQRGGMRILKLKSATVNSAQSPLGSGRGTAAATAVASRARVAPWAQAVGGLTGGNPASLNKLRASTNPSSNSSPTPAGAFGSLPPNSVSLSMRSAPAPRAYTKPPASAAHARVQEEEAFPALPEQPAKRFPAFSGPGARGGKTMVWGVPRAVAAAQAAAQQQQQQGQSSGIALDGEDGVGQGGKARKGGKGRETLMRWG